MHKKALVGIATAFTLAGFPLAMTAQAATGNSLGYPRFGSEGRYPERTACRYRLHQARTVLWNGWTIRLKYFYNGRCGSFARIENAPQACMAVLWRTNRPGNPSDPSVHWSTVYETVDPGIDFAYTKVANNLYGRQSSAGLACDGAVVATTDWY